MSTSGPSGPLGERNVTITDAYYYLKKYGKLLKT